MSKRKQRFLYTAYIVLVTVFFLYYLFPSESLKNYIITKVQAIRPDMSVTLNHVAPDFPFGVELSGISVYQDDNPIFDAERLSLSPRLLSLFTGRLGVTFNCDAYEGNIKGNAAVPLTGGKMENMAASIALAKVHVADIPALKLYLPQYHLSGVLTGDMTYNGKKNNKKSGDAQLKMVDCGIEFMSSVYGLESLAFKQIDAEMNLTDDVLRIEKLMSDSTDISGSITGTITIKKPFKRSVLNLNGDVIPGAVITDKLQKLGPMVKMLLKSSGGNKGIPVRLTGTIEKPGFFK